MSQTNKISGGGSGSQSMGRVIKQRSGRSCSSSNSLHRYHPAQYNSSRLRRRLRSHPAEVRGGSPRCRRGDMYRPTHRRRWAMCRRRVMGQRQ